MLSGRGSAQHPAQYGRPCLQDADMRERPDVAAGIELPDHGDARLERMNERDRVGVGLDADDLPLETPFRPLKVAPLSQPPTRPPEASAPAGAKGPRRCVSGSEAARGSG